MIRINQDNKWKWVCLAYVFFCCGYLLAGRYYLGQPSTWPQTTWDAKLPFVPFSIWIYWSQYALLGMTFTVLHCSQKLSVVLSSMVIASALAFVCFALFPVHFPRQHPLPSGLTGIIFSTTYLVDRPTNCFPSLHVALATIAFLGLRTSRWNLSVGLWTLAIIVSTLTTKQHYVFDVGAGLILAISVYAGMTRFHQTMFSSTSPCLPDRLHRNI